MRTLIQSLIQFFRCFYKWRVNSSSEKKLKDSDVILAQSFGLRAGSYGKSNKALAIVVQDLYERFHLPLILQWEIADCLPGIPKQSVIREHRQIDKYLDTMEVISQSKDVCKQYNWEKAIVVAHPDHIWRVVQIAKKMGFVIRIANVSSVPYDSLSVQSWTRSKFRFLPREFLARILYLLHGWI